VILAQENAAEPGLTKSGSSPFDHGALRERATDERLHAQVLLTCSGQTAILERTSLDVRFWHKPDMLN
jgi:hypothetical protein